MAIQQAHCCSGTAGLYTDVFRGEFRARSLSSPVRGKQPVHLTEVSYRVGLRLPLNLA